MYSACVCKEEFDLPHIKQTTVSSFTCLLKSITSAQQKGFFLHFKCTLSPPGGQSVNYTFVAKLLFFLFSFFAKLLFSMTWSIREHTSSMYWSVWPDTALRRCLILSHPSIIPVDMKRCVSALVFLNFTHCLCCGSHTPSPLPWMCPQVVTPLVWNKPDPENSVPLWIIILAILAGLLLLALLIYVLYKVGEMVI